MPVHHHAIHHRPYHKPPAIIISVGDQRPVPLTETLRREYEKLFKTLKVKDAFTKKVSDAAAKVAKNKDRYARIESATSVPWYVVGALHLMECDCNFNCHLHNGDPLKARTKNVPKGRPVVGKPPFTWEESAIDVLQLEGLDKWPDWTISGILYKLETYNGFGSRNRGVATPYLWSGSQFYSKGKYVRDGKWDPKAVSEQTGAALVLKKLATDCTIEFPTRISVTPFSCEK